MNLTNQEILGDILINARNVKGYSQRHLAALTGISNVEISKLEKGERLKPNPEFLMRLSEALDLEYEELLEAIGYIDNAPFEDNQFLLSKEDKNFIIESLKKRWSSTNDISPENEELIYKSIFNSREDKTSTKEIPLNVHGTIKKICDLCSDSQLRKFISLCNWFIENELRKEE